MFVVVPFMSAPPCYLDMIGICIVLINPYIDEPLGSQLLRHFVRMYLIQEMFL